MTWADLVTQINLLEAGSITTLTAGDAAALADYYREQLRQFVATVDPARRGLLTRLLDRYEGAIVVNPTTARPILPVALQGFFSFVATGPASAVAQSAVQVATKFNVRGTVDQHIGTVFGVFGANNDSAVGAFFSVVGAVPSLALPTKFTVGQARDAALRVVANVQRKGAEIALGAVFRVTASPSTELFIQFAVMSAMDAAAATSFLVLADWPSGSDRTTEDSQTRTYENNTTVHIE